MSYPIITNGGNLKKKLKVTIELSLKNLTANYITLSNHKY